MNIHADAHPYTRLVERARAGDLEAFGELVERFQDMVVGDAWGRLGDLADAVDVAQDTFLDALRKLELLRDPAAFPTWLRTIVATHCARARRRTHPMPESVASVEPSLEDEVVDRDRARRVRRLVGQLPPAERAVVAMHYLGGATYAEIASYLDISEPAAKQRAHAARARLREDWKEPMDIEGALDASRPSRDHSFRSATLLFAAIAKEDVEVARRLLDDDASLVDAEEDWDDDTARATGMLPARHASPLLRAVGRSNRELVHLLLRHGAEVNRACGCAGGESPLWAATAQGDKELVALLLDAGADPDAPAFRGTTPLHVAAMRGSAAIAQLLSDAGADADVQDDDGRTPGDWADLKGYDIALSRGGVSEQPEDGPSALLESGIKAINLFAPLARGGVVRWVGPAGTGSLVVLTELLHNLATFEGLHVEVLGFEHAGLTAAELRHAFAELGADVRAEVRLVAADRDTTSRRRTFADACCLVVARGAAHRPKAVVVAAHPDHLADVEVELPRLRDGAELVIVAALDDRTTQGLHLPPATSTITLSHALPRAGLYPAIDPVGSVGPYPDGDHEEVTHAARELLARYLEVDPTLTLEADDTRPWTATAQALLRALTQPFHTAEPFTGHLGASLSIADTVRLTRAVLRGEEPADLDEHTLHIGA